MSLRKAKWETAYLGSNTKNQEEQENPDKNMSKSQEGNEGHTSEIKQSRPAKGRNKTIKTCKAGRHLQSETEE